MGLDKEQLQVVEETHRPVFVFGLPGTGKSFVFCSKVLFLVRERGIVPKNILVLVANSSLASSFTEQVQLLSLKESSVLLAEGFSFAGFRAKTFGSYVQELFLDYGHKFGRFDSRSKLLDEADILYFLKHLLKTFTFSSFSLPKSLDALAEDCLSLLVSLRGRGISLDKVLMLPFEDANLKGDVFTLYLRYEEYKKKHNFYDSQDLLLTFHRLLEDEAFCREIRSKIGYLFVDDFQDLSVLEYQIFEKICPHERVSIAIDFSRNFFSGSVLKDSVENLLSLWKVKTVTLRTNYRFSKRVLNVFESFFLQGDETGKEKNIAHSLRDELGDARHYVCEDEEQCAVQAITLGKQALEKGETLCFLTRSSAHARSLSSFFWRAGLSHHLGEVSSFLSVSCIHQILLTLRVLKKTNDAGAALFSLLQSLSLEEHTVVMLSREAHRVHKPLLQYLLEEETFVCSEMDKKTLEAFVSSLRKLFEKSNLLSLCSLARAVIEEFSYVERILTFGDAEAFSALLAFEHFLVDISEKYSTLGVFELGEILEKKREISSGGEHSLHILTLDHVTGKEFDTVVLYPCTVGDFPLSYKKSIFSSVLSCSFSLHQESERSFFSFALSRAKQNLFFLSVKQFKLSGLVGRVSPYLFDLKGVVEEGVSSAFSLSGSARKLSCESAHVVDALLAKDYDLALHLIEDMKKAAKKTSLLSYFSPQSFALVLDEGDRIYSVSKLETYRQCPKKYLFHYVYKVPVQQRPYFDFGVSMHAVIEHVQAFVGELPREIVFAKALEYLREFWKRGGYESEEQEQEYFEKGVHALRLYIERECQLQSPERSTLCREEAFLFEWDGILLRGVIDRVDTVGEDLEIIDYKTSQRMLEKKDLATNLQLHVYAKASLELYNRLPKRVALWYLVKDTLSFTEVQTANVEFVLGEVKNLVSSIEGKNFEPKASFGTCTFCDFNLICKDAVRKK